MSDNEIHLETNLAIVEELQEAAEKGRSAMITIPRQHLRTLLIDDERMLNKLREKGVLVHEPKYRVRA